MLVNDARYYATEKHWEQHQEYDGKPYAFHLQQVVNVLLEDGVADDETIAAAWLHDVLEDTDTSMTQLEVRFGPTVTAYVWACTGVGSDKLERAASIRNKINTLLPGAANVKVADRIANLEYSKGKVTKQRAKYLAEREAFDREVASWACFSLQARLNRAYEG